MVFNFDSVVLVRLPSLVFVSSGPHALPGRPVLFRSIVSLSLESKRLRHIPPFLFPLVS